MKEIKGVQIIHKNFPLDKKCNRLLKTDFHENACLYARYSVAAEDQGKWGQMNDILFKNTPKNEDAIIMLTEQKGFNLAKLTKDANSEETLNKIKADIEEGLKYNLTGTPTLIINGEVYSGLKPYNEVKKLLQDALKETK